MFQIELSASVILLKAPQAQSHFCYKRGNVTVADQKIIIDLDDKSIQPSSF